MSNKSYLEVYVPHNILEAEEKIYWDKYVEQIHPLQESLPYDKLIAELEKLPNYVSERPTKPLMVENGIAYVFRGELIQKYIVPEAFIKCFAPNECEKYANPSEEGCPSFKGYVCVSTIEKAKKRLFEHKEEVKDKAKSEYKEYLEGVIAFINNYDDKGIIRLNSGLIHYDDSDEEFEKYNPFEF